MYNVLAQGLDQSRERWCLGACVAVCLFYISVTVILGLIGTRIDTVFLAQRDAMQLGKLRKFPLPTGVPVALSQEGRLAPSIALLRGWSIIEPWGVWTEGNQAQFAVDLPASRPAAPVLELWTEIVRPPDGKQGIRLAAGGQALGDWEITTPDAVFCTRLPNGQPDASGLLRVSIDIGSPVRPPGGLDRRKLGLGLVRLEILADRKSCDPHAKL